MAPKIAPSIVWFRKDLRINDNPALLAAVERGGPVVPVFVWAPEEEKNWPLGGASKWWLYHSLTAHAERLESRGAPMIIRRGESLGQLQKLVKEIGAGAVFWNRRYEPAIIERDKKIKKALAELEGAGGEPLEVKSFNSALLFEPHTVETKTGGPYKVYTPFWKTVSAPEFADPPKPQMAPTRLTGVAKSNQPKSLSVDDLELLPKIDWAGGIREAWTPGEEAARQQLKDFLDDRAVQYKNHRDHPAKDGTSRLSPYLHWGEISVQEVWHEASKKQNRQKEAARANNVNVFRKEVVWREFAHHLLYHFPETPEKPLYDKFNDFPWKSAHGKALRRWQKGQTGYPIVDAGMRQLWQTGWMHNRVRMIVGSFLVKDLLISWEEGARWFWDTLVDADLASNTLGWQWVGGCGADAAPYFRVFNPMTQSKKFDPRGEYIREFVPEISKLPDEHLHAPWEAPGLALAEAGIELGKDYPEPIVNHSDARERALEAYNKIKSGQK